MCSTQRTKGEFNAISYINSEIQTGGQAAESIVDGGLGKRAVILFYALVDKLLPKFERVIFGTDIIDPIRVKSSLNEKVKLLEKIISDPEIQEALRKLAGAYATMGVQTINAIKPSIDMVTEETWETLSQVASKSAVGAINTGLNFTEAALGEIPILGGGIALVLAFMRGMNAALLAVAPAVESGTAVSRKLAHALPQIIGKTQNSLKNIKGQNQEIMRMAQRKIGNAQTGGEALRRAFSAGQKLVRKSFNPKRVRQKGGKAQLYRRINRATRRINRSVSRFTICKKNRRKKKL